MKTTLHYIIAILLLSLNATHAFAEREEGPFNITKDRSITCVYNEDQTLLTIRGGGSITITGGGKTVECGIVVEESGPVNLTIKDLHIQAEAALMVHPNSEGHLFQLTLEGTNKLESTEGLVTNAFFAITGPGSLTVQGGEGASAIRMEDGLTLEGNPILVAIGGKGAEAISGGTLTHDGGLLIQGKVTDGGTIEHTSSVLKGNLTLGTDFEIPSWATVTIPKGQSITVPKGITLTNKGSIVNEGTLTNKGSIVNEGTFETNGIITSSKSLNIGGDDGFDVSTEGNNSTFRYDKDNNLLTIDGGGSVLLKGRNKNQAVNCGIVIANGVKPGLTIEDLNIKADAPWRYENRDGGVVFNLNLKGTNILESTDGPGIDIEVGNLVYIKGTGSLKVIGGNGAYGIQGDVNFNENVCVVAIGGEEASGGINPAPNNNADFSGLFISGTKQTDGSITQDYSQLKGNNITLGGNLEIPKGATVKIADEQTFTIAYGVTLTNNGAIINEGTLTQTGTFINNGTLTENGIVSSSKSLNIGGDDGFDVSTEDDGTTFRYDKDNNLLTIDGDGSVLLKGRNKDQAVNCGIVIAKDAKPELTIEDLNIKADAPWRFEKRERGFGFNLNLKGTNILESTKGPGIDIEVGNLVHIKGTGSLKVIGGKGASGIQGNVSLYENACVVAIGDEGASGGINPAPDYITHFSGLLISGTKQPGGSITQDYSQLKGNNITLGGNLEIPKWATVNIADEQTFTIADGVTLTNNGTITNNGTLHNNGTLTGNKPQHHITFKANDSASTDDKEAYFLEGETLPTNIFTRSGYTFQGWFTESTGGTKVETVTGAQTLYAQWEADKQPEPPYVPVYHSVYLPQVEGATTDPGPGEYEVESWNTFRFYLTIDSAYSESQPVVTTDRGETLVPRSSDGAYLVKYVRTDVEVFIDGLFKNPPPVANEAISADALVPQIWAEGSMLCIRMPEALPSAPVRIFTVDGRLYDSFASTPGLNRRPLPTGIYIVRLGETVRKIIVE